MSGACALLSPVDRLLTAEAERDLWEGERLGYADLPICIAKTEKSPSDDPHQRGRPTDFEITGSRVGLG